MSLNPLAPRKKQILGAIHELPPHDTHYTTHDITVLHKRGTSQKRGVGAYHHTPCMHHREHLRRYALHYVFPSTRSHAKKRSVGAYNHTPLHAKGAVGDSPHPL